MSKTANTAGQAAEPVAPQVSLTLSEFCLRLSESVRRPELISGFEYVERRAGRLKDTHEAFQGRFEQFVKTPV